MENTLLQFLILINTIKQARIGGVLWIFIQEETLLLFDSLGLEGFNFFIVDNNENIIEELLYNIKKCKTTNQKITLCTMTFSTNNWEKLVCTKKEQLTGATQNLFHLLKEFFKLKRTNEMNILIVEHPVQEITHSSCGLFQLYFY